ncbi:type VII secretion target [[Mycobacterium] nativiensis]|uniref:Type VII secretion target n=1 Tax=[Mycobacterium] nativiensis TaxID=2855503 RepID=A0ABU5Y342_9MYCO|nr:type VII secretion target [Mycolicibacter sp. MYC340]MEB3034558.1 type VII secretion target [Mycolicibacter sp. MYC340]
MTSPVLRVTPVSLRELAQRCAALSGQVAPALPTTTSAAWQSSGAATSSINTGASSVGAASKTRMIATSNKLGTAAGEYESMDHYGAAALAAVPQHAGGLPSLIPRSSGVDGGAGKLGV